MASGDDRYIPPPAQTFQDVDERLRDIWEVLHTLEGRTGTVAIRESMTISGDLDVSGDITATGTVELSDHLQVNLRPRSADLSLSPPVSGTSDSSIYYDFSADRLRVSENQRAYQDLVMYEACRVTNSANISIPDSTITNVTFDTEQFDTAGMHSTSSNTHKITIPVDGIYATGACLSWVANATGIREMAIQVNGSTIVDETVQASTGGQLTTQNVKTIWKCTAGDVLTTVAYQTSGGALSLFAFLTMSPAFWAVRLI